MAVNKSQVGLAPNNFVYERRASTLTSSVPAGSSGYTLLYWTVPHGYDHALVGAVGTDQHLSSYYTWVVDGVDLPISGPASVGSAQEPFVFPVPLYVSGYIALYINNFNTVAYPNTGTNPDDEYGYECVFIGQYT